MSVAGEPREDLVAAAKAVLDANWRGRSTVPSPGQYPHQWNWDSGLISIGRSRYDQARAETEMLSLFEAQWRTGMVPHIVFDPSVPPGDYFPGPDFWRTEDVESAPWGISTSGITQPPVHAFAALEMHRHAADLERSMAFLRHLFPRFVALHDFLKERRCVGDEGLVAIVHPWESGMDNSPAWDEAMERVDVPEGVLPSFERRDMVNVDPQDRPKDEAYDRFVYLAISCRDAGYDDRRVCDTTPFLVEEPLTNAVWAWSSYALAEIAAILGEDGRRFREDGERIVGALETKLWDQDHGRFFPFDLRDGAQMDHHSIVSFMPLIAPGLDAEKAHLTVHAMGDVRHCKRRPCYVLPSYDVHDHLFDPRRYWRGPIWINTDWLLYRGCRAVGEEATADDFRDSILGLVAGSGFREYFDVHGEGGYGADRFSWTAALYLDVALGG